MVLSESLADSKSSLKCNCSTCNGALGGAAQTLTGREGLWGGAGHIQIGQEAGDIGHIDRTGRRRLQV